MIQDNPYIQKLLSLNLPTDDYAIFGSGPMFAHGIKDLGHDIDIIARGKAWKIVSNINSPQNAFLGGNLVVVLFEGEIEVFNGWAPGEWDVNKLIDQAEIIEGIRFASLENVLKWKKILARDKDLEHIKMIETYISER